MPARKRVPSVILAALHDLALSGRAPALARAYVAADPGDASADAAGEAAVQTLLDHAEEVAELAVSRPVLTKETGRYAVLYPAVAEAARRVGAGAVG